MSKKSSKKHDHDNHKHHDHEPHGNNKDHHDKHDGHKHHDHCEDDTLLFPLDPPSDVVDDPDMDHLDGEGDDLDLSDAPSDEGPLEYICDDGGVVADDPDVLPPPPDDPEPLILA